MAELKIENEDEEENINISLGPFQLIHKKLGDGKYGTVYEGVHKKTKIKVAIKEIRKKEYVYNSDDIIDDNEKKEERDEILLKNELETLKKLHHPYICRMLYNVKYNEDYYIVLEYGGETYEEFKERKIVFSENEMRKFFAQILSAIEYLHKNYIVHHDIKIENILFVKNGDAKLVDFGFSEKVNEDGLLYDDRRTPAYAPPEIYTGDPYNGFLADIWSLGVSFYWMILGKHPLSLDKITYESEVTEKFENEEIEIPEDAKITEELKDLLLKMLAKDPDERLTLDKIKNHPWLRMNSFDFTKSPGISISKEILPVDLEIVTEMGNKNLQNIKKIIKFIINNDHNKFTAEYYLRIIEKINNNQKSIADIRPSSDLFINYIKSEKSKFDYYNYDIEKIVEELTKDIRKQLEKETFSEIKNCINNDNSNSNNKKEDDKSNKNNFENKNNYNETIDISNKRKRSKKLKARSRSFGKFDLKNYIKEEDNQIISGQKIKVNKIDISQKNNENLADDTISKEKKSVEEDKKEVNLQIEIEQPNNSTKEKKSAEINIIKNNAFTISVREEFGYLPTIDKADKTASFGFYRPMNNKNKMQTIDVNITEEKFKNKLFDKNKNKNNKNETKTLANSKFVNRSTVNIKHSDRKNNKIIKKEEPKINNKVGLLTSFKKKISNAVQTISNKFHRFNKKKTPEKEKKNKIKIKPKDKKRSGSTEIKSKLYLNNLFKDTEINNIISKKRSNSHKKTTKSMGSKKNEKKLEKKAQKFITKNPVPRKSKENNLDTNINIDEIISEKNNPKNKKFKRRTTSSSSSNISKSPSGVHIGKNNTRTIVQDHNNNTDTLRKKSKVIIKTTFRNENYKSKANRKYPLTNNTSAQKSIQISPNKATKFKSSLFQNTSNAKKSAINIKKPIQSFRQNLKFGNENDSNKNTIDTSSRKKSNAKNSKMSTLRNLINKKIRLFSDGTLYKKEEDKKVEEKKFELTSKKDMNLVKSQILKYLGENNTSLNMSKTGVKFVTKMFFGKKKLEFRLNLVQIEKNKYSIIGEVIEGDSANFEKIFLKLKDILK